MAAITLHRLDEGQGLVDDLHAGEDVEMDT